MDCLTLYTFCSIKYFCRLLLSRYGHIRFISDIKFTAVHCFVPMMTVHFSFVQLMSTHPRKNRSIIFYISTSLRNFFLVKKEAALTLQHMKQDHKAIPTLALLMRLKTETHNA